MSSGRPRSAASLRVSNVGGIDETTVLLEPGITVLAGRNASNRTSLLQAIAASLGSEHASIKGDADSAEVTLEMGDEQYRRTLHRDGGSVTSEGEAYLEDPAVADLFAFMFSWNEARRAATAGEDLREVLMRPVDTDRINAEIERLAERKDRIDEEIAEIDALAADLPELERRRSELMDDLESKREELSAARDRLAAAEGDPEGRDDLDSTLEERLDELKDRRSALEDVRFDVRTERESLESLREERSDLEERLSELPEVGDGRIEGIERDLERLRERKRSLEASINELDGIVSFNEEMLESGGEGLFDGDDDAPVTDALVDDGAVTCWTCGTDVERSAISGTIDRLRSYRKDRVEERADVEDELASLKDERDRLAEARRTRRRTEGRLDRIDDEIADRQRRLEQYESRREELESEVEELETEVERLQTDDEEVLERQRAVSELEFEVETLEEELAEVTDEIERVEARVGEREDLEAERETVQSDLKEARNRIERIESEAVEAFNDHIESLLEALEYDDVDRVWIERTETERREGPRTVTRPTFDLHVVRTTEEGVAYEDTVEHLSESEREVIGLVFALAGYLAHDVYEDVPFVLLDSLEAIDSERIGELVEYFGEYAEYLVVALLPEDAAAVDADDEITSI